jgi:DNA-binding transcriptional LysR family regulator
MDLRQLRYFVAAVEAGGLRRASRKLYVSQPSITTAIQSLEAELGVELLSRTPHGILVTEHGRELLRHAEDLLARAERAKAAVRRVGPQRPAALRVALSSGIITAGELTMPILDRFREQHPNVRLDIAITELRFADTSALLSGLVDAAIVRGPLVAFEAPRLEVIPLVEEPRVLLVGANHELAGADAVDLDDVMDEPTLGLLAPERWSAFWQMNDHRRRPNVNALAPPVSRAAEIQFAIASSSTVLSIPGAMARLAPSPLVTAVPLRHASISTIGMIFRKDERSAAVSDFVESARRTVAEDIDMLEGARVAG